MINISVVISAFNEEKMTGGCLESVKILADEIIFIDNSSYDKTKTIAQKYTKKVFTVPNDPVMLNKNKNYGFERATGKWILSLDADERITPELTDEIKIIIKNTDINGFEIPRKNIIFGKWIENSIWWPDYNLRLFRKNYGRFPQKHVHEKLDVKGKTSRLENPIIHYNYQTISQFIKKMDNTYTESEVENFIKLGKSINWYDAIRFPLSDFLKTFFSQKGYRDGMHGLVLSILQAFYSFVIFAKIWERQENFRDITPENFLQSFTREIKAQSRDLKYWIYTALIEESKFNKVIYKIKRKFR